MINNLSNLGTSVMIVCPAQCLYILYQKMPKSGQVKQLNHYFSCACCVRNKKPDVGSGEVSEATYMGTQDSYVGKQSHKKNGRLCRDVYGKAMQVFAIHCDLSFVSVHILHVIVNMLKSSE